MNERGTKILDALDSVSQAYETNPAAIALAWLNSRPGIIAPIASATSVAQLKEITASIAIKLSNSAIELLTRSSQNE